MFSIEPSFSRVRVHCATYNHQSFIKDTMNGFCMQKTTFPFICVIIDDASTDETPFIIRNYLFEHFDIEDKHTFEHRDCEAYNYFFAKHKANPNCYFALYLLKKNHYKDNISKATYYEEWDNKAEYIATCEGDDYWISQDKLQKQISFLDSHRDYTMTCNRTLLYSVRQNKIVGENYCYSNSQRLTVEDTVNRRGLFISTCSVVYRRFISDNKPEYWRSSAIGDYPLQISCVLKGNAWFFNEAMSVYRIDNPASWVGNHNWSEGGADPEVLKIVSSAIKMFKGFAADYPKYKKLFNNKIAEEINRNVPPRKSSRQVIYDYLKNFKKEIDTYPLCWRIDLLFRTSRIPYVRHYYQRFFMHKYQHHNLWY